MRWIYPLSVMLLVACNGGDPAPPGGQAADPAPPAAPKAQDPAPPAAGDSEIQFAYTELGSDHCTSKEIEEDGPVVIENRCKGFGGYDVLMTSSDHGSRLDLSLAGEPLGLSYEDPGWMAEPTAEKIEWRYRTVGGKDQVHALIFRVFWQDSETDSQKSTLMVARIDGSKACVIGSTTSNAEARAIADDMSKQCS